MVLVIQAFLIALHKTERLLGSIFLKQRGFLALPISLKQGGNFHLKVGGAKSSGNAGDPMLGVAVIP